VFPFVIETSTVSSTEINANPWHDTPDQFADFAAAMA
jgi:hypothetical protein